MSFQNVSRMSQTRGLCDPRFSWHLFYRLTTPRSISFTDEYGS
jgi:hypothetical protein